MRCSVWQDVTKGLQATTSDKYRSECSKRGVKRSRGDDDGGECAADGSTPSPEAPAPSDGDASDAILLFERSVMSDRHVFVANCHATGLFQDCEAKVFADWHAWLMKSFAVSEERCVVRSLMQDNGSCVRACMRVFP